MSRPIDRVERNSDAALRKPAPPLDGWRLMEAASILCPRAADLYKEGGEALEIAIGNDRHRLRARASDDVALRPSAWLTLQVLVGLGQRRDLQLTGRSSYNPLAPRVPIPPDQIRAVCTRDNRDSNIIRPWVQLDFRHDSASVGRDVPSDYFGSAQPASLTDVRIEASGPMMAPSTESSLDEGVKPEFSAELGRAWFTMRRYGWPKDQPPPTSAQCLAAAHQYFAGEIPRDLNVIRDEGFARACWDERSSKGTKRVCVPPSVPSKPEVMASIGDKSLLRYLELGRAVVQSCQHLVPDHRAVPNGDLRRSACCALSRYVTGIGPAQ
jgi:hypothetical protein